MNLQTHITGRGGSFNIDSIQEADGHANYMALVRLPVPGFDGAQIEARSPEAPYTLPENALLAAYDLAQHILDRLMGKLV